MKRWSSRTRSLAVLALSVATFALLWGAEAMAARTLALLYILAFAPDLLLVERLDRREEQAELFEKMGDRYAVHANVLVDGELRMQVYRRGGADEPITVDADEYAEHFDQALAHAGMPLVLPDVLPVVTPTAYRFGEALTLAGYQMHKTDAQLDGWLDLILVWRVDDSVEADYTLFAQLLGPNVRKIGQLDAAPDCNGGPTSDWETGDVVVGHHRVPIFADEAPGVYPLLVGLYDVQSHDRLLIYDSNRVFLGDALELARVTVLSSGATAPSPANDTAEMGALESGQPAG